MDMQVKGMRLVRLRGLAGRYQTRTRKISEHCMYIFVCSDRIKAHRNVDDSQHHHRGTSPHSIHLRKGKRRCSIPPMGPVRRAMCSRVRKPAPRKRPC